MKALCLIIYLNLVNHYLKGIREVDKLYGDKLDFKDIKFLFKVKDICKIEKKNSLALAFWVRLGIKIKKISRNIKSMS